MSKRIALSALAGGIVVFILAGLFFGLLFAEFFANSIPEELAAVNREVPNYPMIFVADLVYTGMLAFLFAALAKIKTFRRGAMAGAIIGFAVVLHFDLLTMATTHLSTPMSIAVNVALSTVMSGLGGGVIAAVLGKLEG